MNAASGLSTDQARALLARYGRNAIPVERAHPALALLRRFWGPIPWVLEGALILTIVTRRYADGAAIGFLLIFNAAIAAWQEGKARDALDLLRSRVIVQARVRRDGAWTTLAADELVPGDLVHLGLSAVIPADVRIVDGEIDADESALTGESLPKTLGAGADGFAGTIVRRGSADAVVTATGTSTKFGRTAELVRIAKTQGTLERLVMRLVTALTALAFVVIAIISVAAVRYGLSGTDIALFAVIIALASVPIALPAAFTLATTFGSLDLARKGALVTRLSAIEDAASMDVLCSDKTGTITQNLVLVQSVVAYPPFDRGAVAALAAAASDEAERDPIDLAVIRYAREQEAPQVACTAFTAFDPARKYSFASIAWQGADAVAYKGSPAAVAALGGESASAAEAGAAALASTGARVIAVALQSGSHTQLAGLIALADTLRADAQPLVARLHELGVGVILLTGDSQATALHVAQEVGILPADVHASVYPEQKLSIIRDLQKSGHVVGMTGDGINDAPALKQANIGIAVSNATDVAKSAAGVVLTRPGLEDVVQAVETGRAVYERMLTYTIMKLVKYFEIVGVLTVGFFLTRRFLLTPELMVALLVFNDFVTLSISTDNVSVARTFDVWRIGRLLGASALLALLTMSSVVAVLALVMRVWHPALAELQGAVFLALVTMGQFALFVLRERGAHYRLPPSKWVVAAALFAVAASSAIAYAGALAPRLPGALVGSILLSLAICAALLSVLKGPIFRAAGLAGAAPR